ncbi:MAG: sigma-70 family RNA polymerase sigma factor [Candidatus Pseudobacter hemicellulosilyticus]|uniref:Sigma-70 family RNA polymerase sigma factor n=1 Tax=Candidatus Pseudobacter hemicellulosilyticus TaxID=3121375 RepID=A0AAJ5WNE0_9BACT|nr:MAG: sigma-70 family RNA polymerase sigma factor [Pseudobacter sp.]
MENREQHTEQDLVRRLAAGETEAFQVLFHRYFRRLTFFAANIINNQEDANDLAQEALYQLWLHRSAFREEAQLRSWLYVATRNAALNYLKSSQRRSQRHEETARLLESAGQDLLETAMAREELLELLLQELEAVPPPQATVLKLLFIEGLSYRDIAEKLQIPEATIRKQKERGVRLLRATLLQKKMWSLLLLLNAAQLGSRGRLL